MDTLPIWGIKSGDAAILRDVAAINAASCMSYEQATQFDSLYAAGRKVRRGVMWKDSTARYTADLLKETYKLQRDLLHGAYQIRPYTKFIVTDPKRREVMATQIRDRQLQRSLCDNGLYEAMTRGFIRDNFACQKGRGMDDALDRMTVHLQRYFRKHGTDGWVLKCDIHHYFAETPHAVAKAAVRKRVKDEKMCEAVFQIIDSFGAEKGIGLGSQVSQLIELAVLDDLDHYIKERLRVRHYLRYMDDFVLIHESEEWLKECMDLIREKLEKIGLELNRKTCIFPLSQGIVWLKWHFYLTDTGKVIRKISKAGIRREKRRLRGLKRLLDKGKISGVTAEFSLQSWIACAKRGNTYHQVENMKRYFAEVFT